MLVFEKNENVSNSFREKKGRTVFSVNAKNNLHLDTLRVQKLLEIKGRIVLHINRLTGKNTRPMEIHKQLYLRLNSWVN